MSGPKTAIFSADPMAVLLAAAAIQAAQAVYAGYAEAAALRRQSEERREDVERRQRESAAAGRRALDGEAHALEEEFEHVARLAEKIGLGDEVRELLSRLRDVPTAAGAAGTSGITHDDAVAAHVRGLRGLNADLRAIVLMEAARQSVELADAPEFDSSAALAGAVPQHVARRQLARIAHLAHLGPVPELIEKLALELEQTLPGERADLLATELRAQVQAYLEQQQKQQVQEATALVVGHTLQELGYQVEGIKETLFVEGGVVHFRRSGWGDYMVRLRVDAKAGAVNFNVVRAVAEGDNERSVLDHLAEDRWCAEFPSLLRALEVRGVHLDVTRHLAAGELPVQLVAAARLPVFSDEEEAMQNRTNQTRTLPLKPS